MIDPTVLIVGLGVLVAMAVAVAWLVSRRRPRSGTRAMGREDSISYYRDLGGRDRAPGVHEEDGVVRWGARDDQET